MERIYRLFLKGGMEPKQARAFARAVITHKVGPEYGPGLRESGHTRRRMAADIRRTLRGEARYLIANLIAEPEVKKRRDLVRMLRRRELAAVGRVLLAIEADPNSSAGETARKYYALLDRMKERFVRSGDPYGEDVTREPTLALPVFNDPPQTSRRPGRPLARKDWRFFRQVVKSEDLAPWPHRHAVSAGRARELGVSRRDLIRVVSLIRTLKAVAQEAGSTFDDRFAWIVVGKVPSRGPEERSRWVRAIAELIDSTVPADDGGSLSSPGSWSEPLPSGKIAPRDRVAVRIRGGIQALLEEVTLALRSSEQRIVRRRNFILEELRNSVQENDKRGRLPEGLIAELRAYACSLAHAPHRESPVGEGVHNRA